MHYIFIQASFKYFIKKIKNRKLFWSKSKYFSSIHLVSTSKLRHNIINLIDMLYLNDKYETAAWKKFVSGSGMKSAFHNLKVISSTISYF